jgi:transcriptional regulator of acetoin/glycerol metabolism
MLLDYAWPGNVRELANVIEYAVVVARGETILPDDLPQEILHPCSATAACPAEESIDTTTASHLSGSAQSDKPSDEATHLQAVLEKHHWKRADAAKELGLSRSTLWRKIRELKLQ